MDVFEPESLQLGHAPIARPIHGGRALRAGADLGGQRFRHVPGGAVGQGLIAERYGGECQIGGVDRVGGDQGGGDSR